MTIFKFNSITPRTIGQVGGRANQGILLIELLIGLSLFIAIIATLHRWVSLLSITSQAAVHQLIMQHRLYETAQKQLHGASFKELQGTHGISVSICPVMFLAHAATLSRYKQPLAIHRLTMAVKSILGKNQRFSTLVLQ
jgi:hypothetical protein